MKDTQIPELTKLPNIGKTVAQRLCEIGIFTEFDLRTMGAAKAYQLIQANYPKTHLPLCYYLYSLEGALQNKDWRDFTNQEKSILRKKAGI